MNSRWCDLDDMHILALELGIEGKTETVQRRLARGVVGHESAWYKGQAGCDRRDDSLLAIGLLNDAILVDKYHNSQEKATYSYFKQVRHEKRDEDQDRGVVEPNFRFDF
jgi:hypothetical protein